jgi:hypothetical protein
MASTPPHDGVDNQMLNTIVAGAHDDSAGMPAESLDSAVATLEKKIV